MTRPLHRRMASTLIVLACIAFAFPAYSGEPGPDRADLDHADFAAILRATVRDQRVDYAAIRDRHLVALDAYLDRVTAFDADSLETRERLALLINLYNASMIRAVIERDEPGFSPADGEFGIFKDRLVRLDGARISLDHLEHEILRKEFDEPRIHVALVCAARSCPPLLPRAYDGADLEQTLESNMRRFVNDPTRNRIDRAGRRLELSSLFDWFADDFGGKAAIAGYVNRYTDVDVSSYAVTFVEYDWTLNSAP